MKYINFYLILTINFLIVVSQHLSIEQQCKDFKDFFNNNKLITKPSPNSCCGILEIDCGNDKNIVNILNIGLPKQEIVDFSQLPDIQNIDTLTIKNILFSSNEIPSQLLNPNLKNLKIIFTNLNDVPNSIGNLMKLEELMIYGSKVSKIPVFLKNLPNLKNLSLSNTTTTLNFPNEIKEFKALETLDLGLNKLASPLILPPNLKTLILNACKVSTFEANDIEALKQLTNLDLSGNAFADPNIMFKKLTVLTELKKLVLSYNKITLIPKLIDKMQNLEELHLGNNKIQVLPEELYKLKKLKLIELTNNSLNGKFGFDYEIEKCLLGGNNLCYTYEHVCKNNKQMSMCDDGILKATKDRQNTFYNQDNETELDEDTNQDQKNKKNNSFFESKAFLISIIIIIIIIVLFIVYFCLNNNNNNEQIYTTYAYSDNEKNRKLLNDLNLNNSNIKSNKLFNENTMNQSITNQNLNNQNSNNYNESFSNLQYNNNNNNILNNANQNNNNSSNNNLLNNETSFNNENITPLLNNSYGEINYNNNNNSFINNVGSSSNMIMAYNNTSNINGGSSSNSINTNLMNTAMQEEQLKLQAKIRKEMLATEEMLINKKAKDGNYKDDNDQPPPYSQFNN